jgi:aminoglycoside phosphotransferase (APT) family kinase protein
MDAKSPSATDSLADSLPADLRASVTAITPITATSFSSAGVYRVEAAGEMFVLKISDESKPLDAWRRRLQIVRLAADAGLAPPVIHVDEERRAVVTPFVVDRSFPALYLDPRTHQEALSQLGRTIRRIHDLPLSSGADSMEPRDALATIWSDFTGDFLLPPFVVEAVGSVLAEEPPECERAPVLSHNDLHPANLLYDGENLLFVDWDSAGANDPFYDLAAISLFLLMDEETSRRLLAAYDDMPASALPARFAYYRRLVGVFCGVTFLRLARRNGHAGAKGGETAESTTSLAGLYQQMRSGSLNLATAEGLWSFGLALVKEGVRYGEW